MDDRFEELRKMALKIPRGKCISYGRLGALLPHPLSGREVGRWLARGGHEIPWWRIVNRNGEFSIAALDPHAAMEQQARVLEEGIPVKDGKVVLSECLWEGEF